MKSLKNIWQSLAAKRRIILISIANAFVILLLCYLYDNMSISLDSDATTRQWFERAKSICGMNTDSLPDDLLIVNIAYDRQLVDVTDNDGIIKGNTDITDRQKLLQFLTAAREADNYNYIILDVNFNNHYTTEWDSALYATISAMPRIVIPKHHDDILADSSLYPKSRYSEYATTIIDEDFAKYDLLPAGEHSLPLSVYNELSGKDITQCGFLYFADGHLSRRCITPRFVVKAWDEYDENGNKIILNLGCDIINLADIIPIADHINDRIILIGDITERDRHDTYMGNVSGAIINVNTIYALMNGSHIINWWSIILLLIFYSVVSGVTISGIDLMKHLPLINRIKSKTIIFLFSFIGFSFILTIFATLSYVLLDAEFNVVIPSLYFSIYNLIANYITTLKQA